LKNKQRNNKSPVSSQRGFTLLEVLIAVMILGLSITTILQQFSVALYSGSKTQEVIKAVIHAREKLEETKIKKELSESTESGSFEDGYEWETSVIPYIYPEESEDEQSYEKLMYETFQIKSVVTWRIGDHEKQIQISTLKTNRKLKWQ
jgi:prepilin-type N-terminal cleavage/methylation domain-containing protein